MRGNGIFHKIGGTNEEVPGAAHSILHPQQANLPTKTNYQSLQVNKTNNPTLPGGHPRPQPGEKNNEGLRSQLRRSYDANSGNLPYAAHSIQPSSTGTHAAKLPNRPHSSNKMNSQLPRQPPQQASTAQSAMNEKPKGNRKRDFSKVVDIASRALNSNSQTIEHNSSATTASN